MNRLFQFISLVFILCSAISIRAQSYSFVRYASQHGISNQIIRCITQDNYGFIWLATEDGLNRFDGYSWKVYKHNPNDSASLPDNFIYSVSPANDGGLWVSTNNAGIAKYQPETDDFKVYNSKQIPALDKSNRVDCVMEDEEGVLWIATYLNGVIKFNPIDNSTTIIPDLQYSFPSSVTDLIEFDDKIISRNRDGIGITNKTSLETELIEIEGILNSNAHGSLVLLNNKVYTTDNENLIEIDLSSKEVKIISVSPKLTNDVYTAIYGIHAYNNILWIAYSGGLISYNIETQTTQYYEHHERNIETIGKGECLYVFVDNTENFWLSVMQFGISKTHLSRKAFKHYSASLPAPNKIFGNTIRSIHFDSDDKLWVGFFESGANIIDLNTSEIEFYSNKEILGENSFSTLATIVEDSKDRMWLCYWLEGIAIIDRKSKKLLRTIRNSNENTVSNSLFNNTVQAVFEDKYNNFWIGTETNVDIYNWETNTFRHLFHDHADTNSLNPYGIQPNCIVNDAFGNYWVGTWGGLTQITPVIDENTMQCDFIYKRYNQNQKLKQNINDDRVISLYYDSLFNKNELYTGTYGGGISILRLNDEGNVDTILTYSEDDGLVNNVVYGIVGDNKNNLWLSTNNGISKFNLSEKKFINFNANDGLQENQFYWGARAYNRRTNIIAFGGINGMNVFNPDEIISDTSEAQIVFTNFEVNYKQVIKGLVLDKTVVSEDINSIDKLKLSHKENIISFEVTYTHFAFPENNQYRFVLDGFDRNWIELKPKQRNFTYTNIPPGNYVLRVEAANYDQVWTKNPIELAIHIVPPFWKTFWFYMLVALMSLLLIMLVFRLRTQQILKRNKLLTELVKERTYELNVQANQLQETNTLLEERQQQIEEQSEELLSQRDELQELNNVKDKLFSIVAHDLKNPFNIIRGMAELLHFRHEKYDKEKLKKVIDSIYSASNQMNTLLMNLLTWSRSQRGVINVNKKKNDVIQIIRMNMDLVHSQAEAKNIKMAYTGELQEAAALCDDEILNTVIRNLCTNAIKFTPDGGNITLSCKQEKEMYVVSVSDTGVGISKENQSRLFNPVQQVTTYGTGNEKGTGLGLQICKDFIEQHGGSIWFESEENVGTTFHFSLPIKG
jgi:signal transduction histidine kinase/ligand-binding sensor domain-containing protein